MYRITEEIAHYLLDVTKSFNVGGLEKDTDKPFVIKNRNAIGSINPLLVFGSDCRYLVESDEAEGGSGLIGYWLYRGEELHSPNDSIEVPRQAVDRYCANPEDMLEVSDCSVELPSPLDKLVCKKITTLERLFELEPELKECLDPDKIERYGKFHDV